MSNAIALRHQAGSFHAPELDGSRIAAGAGAIAVNAVIAMLLMVPLADYTPPVEETAIQVIEILPRKMVETPPPEKVTIERTPPQPTSTSSQRLAPADVAVTEAVVDAQPGDEALPPLDRGTPDGSVGEPAQPASASVLQALSAPAPAYPREAVRQGLVGTVELEILVGIDGRPLEVRVVRSSGHRALDQAARRAVLTQWTFQPAFRDGQAVQALGRVPIEFKLDR
ncbi:energy transducer TonB [Lysobacter sp. S4-A87]|uniref:energy transducer TonB n=1 Tax=Lysobacter sp. S4-A87 TaxID=2925843 RepID=UPI001F539B73|nr:energy transducer TonB [Lysobacter sp. S4-A87]UNK49374.1 energy transducer TonB [Lysobacter sp. S4-A87]